MRSPPARLSTRARSGRAASDSDGNIDASTSSTCAPEGQTALSTRTGSAANSSTRARAAEIMPRVYDSPQTTHLYFPSAGQFHEVAAVYVELLSHCRRLAQSVLSFPKTLREGGMATQGVGFDPEEFSRLAREAGVRLRESRRP